MEEVASWRRLARLDGCFDGSMMVCQKDPIQSGPGGICTFYNPVFRNLLSTRGRYMKVAMRGDDCAFQRVYDRSASANRGVIIPFLHRSRTSVHAKARRFEWIIAQRSFPG